MSKTLIKYLIRFLHKHAPSTEENVLNAKCTSSRALDQRSPLITILHHEYSKRQNIIFQYYESIQRQILVVHDITRCLENQPLDSMEEKDLMERLEDNILAKIRTKEDEVS